MYWLKAGRYTINLEHVIRFTLETETGRITAVIHFVDGGALVLDQRETELFTDEWVHYLKQEK